jgi:predicted small lipoprotein YifL
LSLLQLLPLMPCGIVPAQELRLSFKSGMAAASADAASTVLTAAANCRQLQQLYVKSRDGRGLGMRSIPGSLAALESLVKLDLRGCGLEGTLQLPPNLTLDDYTAHKLPFSLSTMSSLTRLIATSTAAPPPTWPHNLHVLRVH